MGNFNAKIGTNNSGYENVMSKHGLGKMNQNGELLEDFFTFNSMVISKSVFLHKDIHKATRRSPEEVTEKQITHVTTVQKFWQSLQTVRVKRDADFVKPPSGDGVA